MSILLNQTDCGSAIKGTGTLGCKVDINYIVQFFLIEKGIEFDISTDTLDSAKINKLVQDGQLVILPEHFSFENQSGETVYEELPSGAKIPVRNGLYEFMINYSSGICLANALSSLNSKNWSLWLVDFDNSGEARMWGEETTDGSFKGFDTNVVYAENKVFNDGSVSTKTPLKIQLSTKGTQAMRSRVAYLSSANAVDFAALDGVNDVTLVANTTTASSFELNAFINCDGSTSISSVTDETNWRIIDTGTGTPESGYTVNFTNGQYVITGLTAGTYTVEFYDETNGKDIIISGGVFYDSDVLTVTLT